MCGYTCICIHIYREQFLLREWLTRLWRLASPNLKNKSASWRPNEELPFKYKGSLLTEFLLLQEGQLFPIKVFN